MNSSRIAATAGLVLLCACLLAPTVGCPAPVNHGPFEVLLVNGTPNPLNVFFNTSLQNHASGVSNRIDVSAGSVATARFSADDLALLGTGTQLVLLVSVAPGGSALGVNNPQQTVPDHPAGGQAALLVTACGGVGEARLIEIAP